MSEIRDTRCCLTRCVCSSPTAKWCYKGKYYTINTEYTDFGINALDQLYIVNADKSAQFYSPDGCLLMHYDIAQRSMYGAAHRLAFDDNIRYIFKTGGKLYWFSGGKLYSAPFDPWLVQVIRSGSYMKLTLRTSSDGANEYEHILCRPNGDIIARWTNDTLNIQSKSIAESGIICTVLLEQHDLIAALCDTDGSGYADRAVFFDFDGNRIAEINAVEHGYSCIRCLDSAGLSCPCIGFMKERTKDPYPTITSGFAISTYDIDPSWYDILYNGKEITLKYAYGMTQKFYHYNVVECR